MVNSDTKTQTQANKVLDTMDTKKKLLDQFKREQVIYRSPEEIESDRQIYWDCVASCALEGAAPDEFGNVVIMEKIRGEITEEQCGLILSDKIPSETHRIQEKIKLLHESGLSWKDL